MEGIVLTPPTYEPIGTDKLLTVKAIADMFGCSEETASRIMDESGCAIKLRSRKYVLESSFFRFMHSIEGARSAARDES